VGTYRSAIRGAFRSRMSGTDVAAVTRGHELVPQRVPVTLRMFSDRRSEKPHSPPVTTIPVQYVAPRRNTANIGMIPGPRTLRAPCISGAPHYLSRTPLEPSMPPVTAIPWCSAGWGRSGGRCLNHYNYNPTFKLGAVLGVLDCGSMVLFPLPPYGDTGTPIAAGIWPPWACIATRSLPSRVV